MPTTMRLHAAASALILGLMGLALPLARAERPAHVPLAHMPLAHMPLAHVPLAPGAGIAWRSLPAAGIPLLGVVIVVPDIVGRDGRAEPYVAALAAQGHATLEIELADPAAAETELPTAIVLARLALAADPVLDGLPVLLLGFGAGAEAALAWAGDIPVAALYPRCGAVEAAAGAPGDAAPLLVLHPARDPHDPPGACGRLAARLGPAALRHAYPDATPGWDIPPLATVAGPALLPRDAAAFAGAPGGTRYAARHGAAVTRDAARRVAWFAAAAATGNGPWVPPEDGP